MERSRVFDWISYSHWGMFRIALYTAPDWFAYGTQEDDDLIENI